MTEYYFTLEKLTVGYQGTPVVTDIEVRLKKGEILTLIGPNGAGKSTILKTIVGQLAPISGAVFVENTAMAQISAGDLSRKMAVVLTEKIKTELMTCQDVVATGRYPYTGRFGTLSEGDFRIVNEAMDLVHVTEIRDRDFMKISDGQRQRVMLARAICQEPEIIILDEPTSFLDVKYKLEFLSVLQKLRAMKDLTVIMSIHELELAERVSDKILCVNGKYIDGYGTPEEIFRPGYISSLFGIESGTFDEINMSMELEAPSADTDPYVFVIPGGGSARGIYRKLQRQGISFASGIIYENDLDCPVAEALGTLVIKAPAFEPVPDALLDEARKVISSCSRVICCRQHFGTYEKHNESLLKYAQDKGMEIETV